MLSCSSAMSVFSRVSYPSRPPQNTYPWPPRRVVISTAFLICAAAKANTSALGAVPAPCMYRGLLKQLAVPHSTFLPLWRISSASRSVISSSRALVSFRVAASGAMSRSWKQK